MNRKGFTLVEMLGCLVLLALVLGIGLYSARGTLATSLSTLTSVSENEIYDASRIYILENSTTWININNDEYTCFMVNALVDKGYFEYNDVSEYRNDFIKIVREPGTKVIQSIKIVDSCE